MRGGGCAALRQGAAEYGSVAATAVNEQCKVFSKGCGGDDAWLYEELLAYAYLYAVAGVGAAEVVFRVVVSVVLFAVGIDNGGFVEVFYGEVVYIQCGEGSAFVVLQSEADKVVFLYVKVVVAYVYGVSAGVVGVRVYVVFLVGFAVLAVVLQVGGVGTYGVARQGSVDAVAVVLQVQLHGVGDMVQLHEVALGSVDVHLAAYAYGAGVWGCPCYDAFYGGFV